MNELRDKVDRAIVGPVLHGFDGWRLDKPVTWEQVPETDRALLRVITDAAIATVQEAGWQDIATIGTAGSYTRENMNIACHVLSHVEGWLEVRFDADNITCIVRPSSFTPLPFEGTKHD